MQLDALVPALPEEREHGAGCGRRRIKRFVEFIDKEHRGRVHTAGKLWKRQKLYTLRTCAVVLGPQAATLVHGGPLRHVPRRLPRRGLARSCPSRTGRSGTAQGLHATPPAAAKLRGRAFLWRYSLKLFAERLERGEQPS